MRYPIGIQTFETIRKDGFIYVDKTALVYELTHDFRYVFLSRPRRFGKSLLLSTIKAYFQGKRELFEGLALSEYETEWAEYPVIHLDLNTAIYNDLNALRERIDNDLSELERIYQIDDTSKSLPLRLENIIKKAHKITGQRVVIIIDEYDKPLLEAIGKVDLQEAFSDELRGIYGVMKSQDQHIRFAMFTGVTKFGHLSVFSGLNNITDISFYDKYAAICGITKDEIEAYFAEPIQLMAERYKCDSEQMIDRLRTMYDGYRFTEADVKVFNPFSLLNSFARRKMGAYWFDSGTPKYLVKLLQMYHYDIWRLDGVTADESQLSNMDIDTFNPIPVIYQSGYLTIKDYDFERDNYTLGFPNEEVLKGFMEYLFPFYAVTRTHRTFDVDYFVRSIIDGDPHAFMSRLKSLTADISYEILTNCENDFHNIVYIILTLCSLKPLVERRTSDGSIDMVVETDKYVYIMEFKVNGSAQAAIEQIDTKQYALPWTVDNRKVFKIGANFSTTERRLTDYIIQSD